MTLYYYFEVFDPKKYGFRIPKHFFAPLYHACTLVSFYTLVYNYVCNSHLLTIVSYNKSIMNQCLKIDS